jgi:hypothetical protein
VAKRRIGGEIWRGEKEEKKDLKSVMGEIDGMY